MRAVGRSWVVVAILVVGLLAAGCGQVGHSTIHQMQTNTSALTPTTSTELPTSTAAVPTSSTTQMEHYVPWATSGSLAPGIAVIGTLSGGDCWTTSIPDSPNQYAWRCMAGSYIYDPCFAPPGAANVIRVACARSPFSGVYLLNLTTPLSHSSSTRTATYPWYLVLSNGQHCGGFDGAGPPSVGGVSLDYVCKGGGASAPSYGTEPWTVQYGPDDAGPLQLLTVVQAWN